jgi:hypothetical protein
LSLAPRPPTGPQMSAGMAQVLVIELAFRHRQMVRLMMRAGDQQADEPEAANVLHFLRIGRGDGEQFAIR